jgi:dipeptidyl aminopeptidase/acylaminoacyl peptidase
MWGTNFDPVVPISQQYEFYHALREHHVPVRFVVFPSSTHGPGGERQREVLTRLWLNWLDRFIRA